MVEGSDCAGFHCGEDWGSEEVKGLYSRPDGPVEDEVSRGACG